MPEYQYLFYKFNLPANHDWEARSLLADAHGHICYFDDSETFGIEMFLDEMNVNCLRHIDGVVNEWPNPMMEAYGRWAEQLRTHE